MGEQTEEFIRTIRSYLDNSKYNQDNADGYIFLESVSSVNRETLEKSRTVYPNETPLSKAFLMVIEVLQGLDLTKAKLGINEFLTSYLINSPGGDNQKTREYLEFLFLIFQFLIQDNFPYRKQMWDHFTACYRPACNFLLEENSVEGITHFMEHIVAVGKAAAAKKLDTSNIQRLLRNIEIGAANHKWERLAAIAKENRQTLEL